MGRIWHKKDYLKKNQIDFFCLCTCAVIKDELLPFLSVSIYFGKGILYFTKLLKCKRKRKLLNSF